MDLPIDFHQITISVSSSRYCRGLVGTLTLWPFATMTDTHTLLSILS